jgi:hypothetical protein
MSSGYSGRPLPAKLGLKPGTRVLLLNAPLDLPGLDSLPAGVTAHRRAGAGGYDVVLIFCPDLATLRRRFATGVRLLAVAGAVWVCWPKKASGVATDLGEKAVREHGLTAGLVDVKVAAIDATWSGLKFVRRLADR